MKRKISESVIQQIIKQYFECRSPKLIRKKYGIVKSTLYNGVRERRTVKRPEVRSMMAMQIYAMERKMKTLQKEKQIFKECGCSPEDSIDKKMAAIEGISVILYMHFAELCDWRMGRIIIEPIFTNNYAPACKFGGILLSVAHLSHFQSPTVIVLSSCSCFGCGTVEKKFNPVTASMESTVTAKS